MAPHRRADEMRMRTLGAALIAIAGSRAALAQGYGYIETFEGGVSSAGWTFGAPGEVIATGGAPGAWFHGALSVVLPVVSTSRDSLFTGDLRARHVIGVRASMTVGQTMMPVAGLHPALMLIWDGGTPGWPSDDWTAYLISDQAIGPAWEWR